jgi:hypothetical protein
MSTASPPPVPKKPPGPLAPPEEKFWEKYSPHYEFPLSSVGSVALHIAALLLFLALLWLLARMTFADKTPVPMRSVSVLGEGEGKDGMGSGGGNPQEDLEPLKLPQQPRNIPEARLNDVKEDISPFLPRNTEEGLRPEDLPSVQKVASLSDDLRRKLLQGLGGNKGAGPKGGTGVSGAEGKGSGTQGDPTSSASRAVRWELVFKTESGKDYVAQLAAMQATLVIPNPPDWKTSKVYRNLGAGRVTGEEFSRDQLPGLYFVDDDPASAEKVAHALGHDFSPPLFIAFFPKEIEEELAAKEKGFRGRKEGEIFSTKFKVVIRDGSWTAQVVDQIPVRR